MEDNEISVFDRPRQTRRKRETRNSSDIFLVKSPGTKGTSLFSYNHLPASPNRISRSKSVAYASFSFAVLLAVRVGVATVFSPNAGLLFPAAVLSLIVDALRPLAQCITART
jgi:hypothetical protein